MSAAPNNSASLQVTCAWNPIHPSLSAELSEKLLLRASAAAQAQGVSTRLLALDLAPTPLLTSLFEPDRANDMSDSLTASEFLTALVTASSPPLPNLHTFLTPVRDIELLPGDYSTNSAVTQAFRAVHEADKYFVRLYQAILQLHFANQTLLAMIDVGSCAMESTRMALLACQCIVIPEKDILEPHATIVALNHLFVVQDETTEWGTMYQQVVRCRSGFPVVHVVSKAHAFCFELTFSVDKNAPRASRFAFSEFGAAQRVQTLITTIADVLVRMGMTRVASV